MSTKNVMSAVSTAFSFTSTKINENVLEFLRREELEMSNDQKRKLASIIQGSIEQSLSLTAGSIQKAATE